MKRPVMVVMVVMEVMWLLAAPGAEAQTRIRIGTLAPQGTSYHHVLQALGERWRLASSGQVTTTVYAGTMGSEVELVRRMRLGQLQAGALTVTGLKEIDPGVAALQDMPMMFRSLDEAAWVRQQLEPVITRRLADRGFVALFWADLGWVRYFTREPAIRPDEFRRFKLFVTAGETEQFDLMRQAGFQPVSLEWADALTALQTGMIDAVPTVPYFALSMQINSVTTNMLEVNWLPLVGALVITKRVWDGLTPETQATMRAAAIEAGSQFQTAARAEADSAVTAMQRRGLHVNQLTPAALVEWRATAERLYPRIRGSMVPADMFDEVQRLVNEYRAAHPAAR